MLCSRKKSRSEPGDIPDFRLLSTSLGQSGGLGGGGALKKTAEQIFEVKHSAK